MGEAFPGLRPLGANINYTKTGRFPMRRPAKTRRTGGNVWFFCLSVKKRLSEKNKMGRRKNIGIIS